MNQIFISYSRKDTDFARTLTERLEAEEMSVWVDWQDIPPSVDWMREIQTGIEEADVFLFLVSPDSIISTVCAEELAHGIANGKRIIPVIVREIDVKEAPATITHLNWIFFSRPQDNFDESFEKIITAIRTDYDWVQVHSRLQVKALEWERNSRENSFLLRGKDLQDAEAQLMVNGEKKPKPTDLQREYISMSAQVQSDEIERQRTKEQQLAVEKKTGSRLRWLTYLMLGVFTVAFISLFFWLKQLTNDMAINAIKDQMLALVETSVCFLNVNGDGYQGFVAYFPADDNAVYQDEWYSYIFNLVSDIKNTNKNIQTDIEIYTIAPGEKPDEFFTIVSTNSDIKYKTVFTVKDSSGVHVSGLEKTSFTMTPYQSENGTWWVTACAPIRNIQNQSAGALCTDFNAQLLTDTRQKVTTTLGTVFLAIYPAMILLVIFSTRSVSKMFGKSSGTQKP